MRRRCYLVCLCMFQECLPGIQFSDQSAISAYYGTAHVQSSTTAPLPPRPEHPDARHECEVCGRTFAFKRNVTRHLRTVHSADGPRHECEVCGRKYTQKGNVSEHLRTVHSADGPRHQCEVCGRKFTTKSSLMKHLRTIHIADRPRYQCKVCGRKFKQKFYMGIHLRTVHGTEGTSHE